VARGAMMGRRLRDVEGGGDGLGHPCIDVAAVGGDGGPLAHVEGEAVDLAEVAVEAGDVRKEALGWWRAARSVALPFAVDRAEGDSTQIVANPRDPICCCCGGVTTREA
jgi:hypothetical protein